MCPTFLFFLLFGAPLCLVVGANKYFFGALYKNSNEVESEEDEEEEQKDKRGIGVRLQCRCSLCYKLSPVSLLALLQTFATFRQTLKCPREIS